MNRHLLVTVSEQKSALCGVRFVGKFFDRKDKMRLTLFYTMPRPAAVWGEEKNYKTLHAAEVQEAEIESRGREALKQAKEELVRYGFEAGRIDMKLAKRQYSKAMDIILEGQRGLYDAVVLGRRGLSLLEEAIDESTTSEIFTVDCGFPFYICRRPDLGLSGVLLCVDGSESSRRMTDHVGFMLAHEKRHTVTLFNVRLGAADNPEMHFALAREMLTNNGIAPERIFEKSVIGKDPASAILAEVNENRPAVVATGSTGMGRGLKARLFMGSVSMKLLRELYSSVLWAIR